MSGYQDHKICDRCGRRDLDPLEECSCPARTADRDGAVKLCPAGCQREPSTRVEITSDMGDHRDCYVICMECGFRGPTRNALSSAIAAWNYRSTLNRAIQTPPPEGGEREAFEAEMLKRGVHCDWQEYAGVYLPPIANGCWEGWKARSAWQAARTLPIGDRDRGYAEGVVKAAIDLCIAELSGAAGAQQNHEWKKAEYYCVEILRAILTTHQGARDIAAIIDRLSPNKES